jgi:hypothetical protein
MIGPLTLSQCARALPAKSAEIPATTTPDSIALLKIDSILLMARPPVCIYCAFLSFFLLPDDDSPAFITTLIVPASVFFDDQAR